MDIRRDFQNKRICVALSGGADSVALLHFLKSQAAQGVYILSAVHCEHGIRGEESRGDMRFVQELCNAWKIPLFVFEENCIELARTQKVSLETAARNFRYACFSKLLEENKTDYIATAHHQNDEAETVLFRLARGASLTGAAAMQERNGRYIRPFLFRSKQEILAYVEAHKLAYREDCTNFETQATRNKIRLEVLPKLEEAVPEATKNIARFALLAAEDDALLYELSEKLLTYDEEWIEVAFCDKKPLFTRACLTAMKGVGLEKDYTATHLNALFNLQNLERGAWLTLPKNIRAEKREKGVRFFLNKEKKAFALAREQSCEADEFDGGRYAVKFSSAFPTDADGAWKILRMDRSKLPKTAVFRFRKEGDSIRVFGGCAKSLKKLLNEKKIPTEARAGLPIIAERDSGEVYAVCGVEIADCVKVDEAGKLSYLYVVKK